MSLEHFMVAAETLHRRGEKVTLEAIRKEAGGGSFSTITVARRLWQSQQMLPAANPVEPPPEALQALVGQFWRQACALADGRVATERTALAAARQDLEQGQAELYEMADRLSAEVERQAKEYEILAAERDDLQEQLAKTRTELDVMRNDIAGQLVALMVKAKPVKEPRTASPPQEARPHAACEAADTDQLPLLS